MRFQADFLPEFAKQRRLDLFAAIDSALRKLPAAAPEAAAQEHFARPAGQHDADVGAKTVSVDVIDGGLDGHWINCSISPAACGRRASDLWYAAHESQPPAPIIIVNCTVELGAGH